MVVGEHFDEIVDAAQHQFGGHDVRHHAVFKHHVQQRVVFGVLIFRSQKAFVFEGRQSVMECVRADTAAGRIGLPARAMPSLRFK